MKDIKYNNSKIIDIKIENGIETVKLYLEVSQYDYVIDKDKKVVWAFSRKAMLGLTHNWGTEDDDSQSYHSSNSDPWEFGPIGTALPDVHGACRRCEELGAKFVKKPDDGK